MKQIQIGFFLLCLCSLQAIAQPRSANDAEAIARGILKTDKVCMADDIYSGNSKICYGTGQDMVRPYYVFNDTVAKAFVIVSSDIRIHDVLGVCRNATFDADNIPCGMKVLLDGYAEQYGKIEDAGYTDAVEDADGQEYRSVLPMITTTWGQDTPYNDNCPYNTLSGCVATAMAQVMKYYRYPESGANSFSYTTRTNRLYCSYNFSTSTFDWEAMTDTYTNNSTASSREAVANIMQACGVAVGMDYRTSGQGGSGAYGMDVAYALKKYFRYPVPAYYDRNYFKYQEWHDIVHRELETGRPLIYFGHDRLQGTGHAFVVDGYDSDKNLFHVNWGWEGIYDGYYKLDILNPGAYTFDTYQAMIVGSSPTADIYNEDTFYADDVTITGECRFDEEIKITITGLINMSNSSAAVDAASSFSGIVGIGLYDSNMSPVSVIVQQEINRIKTADAISTITFECTIPSTGTEDGTQYYIAPFVKAATSDQGTTVRTLNGLTDRYAVKRKDSPDDEVEEKDLITVYTEGFNDFNVTEQWMSESVKGNGTWEVIKVISNEDNDILPMPAEGNGYACLQFNNITPAVNAVTVSRFISPSLRLAAGERHILSVKYRSYCPYIDGKASLGLYVRDTKENKDSTLTVVEVGNHQGWITKNVSFVPHDDCAIVLEGNLLENTAIFVDDIKISRNSPSGIINATLPDKCKEDFYDIQGRRSVCSDGKLLIHRLPDGRTIKAVH